MSTSKPFSKQWMWISFGIFIATELILGGLVGGIVVGNYMSLSLRFLLQGILNLLAFFVGGFIVGLITPGIRVYEPAVGAFLSVLVTLILTFFTPFSFIQFSMTKVIIGGGIAFFLALIGAKKGERVSGNKI